MTSLLSKSGLRQKGVKALFALTAFGFGALGAAVVGMSPEEVVTGRFASALEQAAPSTQGLIQVAGTEDYWLQAGGRPIAPIEPAAWSHGPSVALSFAVGDKVTVTREGAERSFKVVSVSAPFKDGEALAVRVTAEDAADTKAAPVVFTVPAPAKSEAGKPRAS